MKEHKQLTVPETSAWDKKSHNPLLLLRQAIYNKWPRNFLVDKIMDKYIFKPYYNVKNGLISFWTWKSVIWKDRHWDDHFIFEVLKHKLILQRKELVSANRHTSIPQTNRDITICLNLIERIQEEFYGTEYMDYFVSDFKWIDFDEYSKELVIDEISNTADDYFKKHRSTVKKCLKKNRDLLFDKKRLAMAVAHENQKKCQALLFRILNERITWWWD
jgi:hypothetical protein